jgi:acyl-CoA synthetase (AMP-forming)/AMP-acid ligase II
MSAVNRSSGWNLLSLFEERLAAHAQKPLFSYLGRNGGVREVFSMQRLHDESAALAAVLQAHGLKGTVVALIYPPGSGFVTAFLASIMAGARPAPLCRARSRDWQSIALTLKHCGATALLLPSGVAESVPAEIRALPGLQILCTDALAGDAREWRRPELSASGTCFIQFTSGSTRTPRGVAISHDNILHNCALIARAFAIEEQDVGVSWLPFHHDMGLIGHVLVPLYCGVHNIVLSPRDFAARPAAWLEAIARSGGSISGAPDFAYALCAERIGQEQAAQLDLSRWRLAYCGSERVNASTMARFTQRFAASGFLPEAVTPCYGMAEATLFVSASRGLKMNAREDGRCDVSVGQLDERRDDPRIRIVSPEARQECAEGEVGEIWVHSRSVAQGYLQPTPAVDDGEISVFNATLERECGYLRTGDLGYVLEDNLYVTGRLKNLIKRRGRSFHAEDIEGEAMALLQGQGIARAVAFDLESQDGAALVLLLELDGSVAAAQVQARLPELQTRLWYTPGILVSRIRLLPERALPLTTSGKLQRARCRERFLAGEFAHV